MTSDIEALKKIPDSKPVRIFIPMLDSAERYRASCVFEQTTPPEFNLLFKPGVLPEDVLDTKRTCLINVDMGGSSLSLEARIKKVFNDQSLEMVLEKSITHDQMREFFRVDAVTKVICSSLQPEFFDKAGKPWRLKGRTVDISGSGILAIFNEPPPKDKQVRLTLTLPLNEPEIISVLARPVRTMKIDENQYEVAYRFDDISTEDRDKIIGCCLIIQRKHLRLKVQVKDAAKL